MAGRGTSETARLRDNIEGQLNRLLTQLQDLEEMKDELDKDEYESSRKETMEQLKEFEASLQKHVAGDMTLASQLDTMQLAIQAAIRNAFKSPEVIRMFAKKENGALRSRLAQLQQEERLGKIGKDSFMSQAFEILSALEKLGEVLDPREKEIVETVSKNMSRYTAVTAEEVTSTKIIQTAATANNRAK